jgi:allantoinase
VFDDTAAVAVTPELIAHRHKVTPYAGETLRGRVRATYLRGERVARDSQVVEGQRGQLL